jgi:transaldolase
MKLFIDTANLKEIEALVPLGIVDGITTNPSLLAREAREAREGDFTAHLKRICALVQGPVSAEVVGTSADAMIAEGRTLAGIDRHIVVKVPFTREGLRACKTLSGEGHRVNVTLVFSPTQALMAAKVGATFVSPFVGRLDDIATSGMELIQQIVEIYDNYEFTTEVLVASVRHPMHIVSAARMGADICTCPAAVIEASLKHPLTDIGIERFLKDWEKAQAQSASQPSPAR